MHRINNKFILAIILGISYCYCFGGENNFNLYIPENLQDKVAISINDLTSHKQIYQYRESIPMLLASNMKLVTSYVGLKELGPDFIWVTTLAYTGKIVNQTLDGDVYLIGGGDPELSSLQIGHMLHDLNVHKINGNLITDKYIFNTQVISSELAPEPLAEYSVNPSGLIIDNNLSYLNLQIRHKKIKTTQKAKSKHTSKFKDEIVFNQQLTGNYRFINHLKVSNDQESCNFVDDYIKLSKANEKQAIIVSGNIPITCGQHTLAINLLTNDEYNYLVLKKALQDNNIILTGKIKSSTGSTNFNRSSFQLNNMTVNGQTASPNLGQVILTMNKQSNNLYAKTILLSLGAYKTDNNNTYMDAKKIYLDILNKDFSFPELTNENLENGAGLSRHEKLTSGHMVSLLAKIYDSPNRELLITSLPKPGESGTLQQEFIQFKNQLSAKTGSLSDTKAYSGYFKSKNGHIYVVSFLANNIKSNDDDKSQLQEFKQLVTDALNNLNTLNDKLK